MCDLCMALLSSAILKYSCTLLVFRIDENYCPRHRSGTSWKICSSSQAKIHAKNFWLEPSRATKIYQLEPKRAITIFIKFVGLDLKFKSKHIVTGKWEKRSSSV